MMVKIEGDELISRLDSHAKAQKISLDDLVEIALRKCEELRLLGNLMNDKPLDAKGIWAEE